MHLIVFVIHGLASSQSFFSGSRIGLLSHNRER